MQYLAFDRSGNLWTSGYNGHGEYRYDTATLATLTATAATVAPNFKSTTSNPNATAFDAAGNLYGLFYPGGRVCATRTLQRKPVGRHGIRSATPLP